jgi:predicted dinucleotide-binding enzyme
MKIAVVGRGKVGGGPADVWERAGHEVQRICHDGGDVSEAPDGFPSNAEYVKSHPWADGESFWTNFALLYDRLGEARAKPGNLWCGDEEARETAEQLIRDAGYEPICAGGLET